MYQLFSHASHNVGDFMLKNYYLLIIFMIHDDNQKHPNQHLSEPVLTPVNYCII